MHISASNRHQLEFLTRYIGLQSEEVRDRLLAKIIATGLMVPDHLGRVLDLAAQAQRIATILTLCRRLDPAGLDDWMAQTTQHILNGTDTEDADSVGGWSQREIDMVVGWIEELTT